MAEEQWQWENYQSRQEGKAGEDNEHSRTVLTSRRFYQPTPDNQIGKTTVANE